MDEAIDTVGLSEEQVQLIKEFVEFLRSRAQEMDRPEEESMDENIIFATHPSDVKGKLTREEIYDYL